MEHQPHLHHIWPLSPVATASCAAGSMAGAVCLHLDATAQARTGAGSEIGSSALSMDSTRLVREPRVLQQRRDDSICVCRCELCIVLQLSRDRCVRSFNLVLVQFCFGSRSSLQPRLGQSVGCVRRMHEHNKRPDSPTTVTITASPWKIVQSPCYSIMLYTPCNEVVCLDAI